MCAIAGIFNLPYNEAILNAMLSTMKHRGPDDFGFQMLPQGCLLHSRLAIIDPTGGSQPMTLSTSEDTFTIVYNGELYNTPEIRKALEALGHQFEGHSDTEVVLHAYAQWRDQCVHRFNGIFAFAVWEQKQENLFLARDRMGVKPLFYSMHRSGLVFASEIKTILEYPSIQPKLSAHGIAQLLLLGPGRIPGSGVFHNINELKPGQCGYYRNNQFSLETYWSLKDREHTESFEQTAEHIRWLVIDAIRRQLVSDVPVGTFLSGGLDSSLISTICAEQLSQQGKMLATFSLEFKNNEKYFVPEKFQPNADTSYIRIMTEHLHSEHRETVLTPEDLVAAMTEATYARDLPGMADVDFSLLAFCRNIRKDVKVALSGECADEIFGGYPWYRDPEVLSQNGFPWAQNTAYRSTFINKEIEGKIDPEYFVYDCYRHTIDECDILPGTPDSERRMKQMVNLNQHWFMQTLLERKDRMSMYHGLEVRVPFCDHRIAEYMYGVPWEFKDYNHTEKGLLRYAMTGLLPKEILWRKKSPYPKTYDPKYLQLMKQQLHEVLAQKNAPLLQLVDKNALEGLLTDNSPWPWYGQLMRLPQTIAYMLQINIWLDIYHVQLI